MIYQTKFYLHEGMFLMQRRIECFKGRDRWKNCLKRMNKCENKYILGGGWAEMLAPPLTPLTPLNLLGVKRNPRNVVGRGNKK